MIFHNEGGTAQKRPFRSLTSDWTLFVFHGHKRGCMVIDINTKLLEELRCLRILDLQPLSVLSLGSWLSY
ncbi:hypothetical protein LBSG162_05160 [Lentilactobacillus buchneri subsp. silagei]|nr:hypothetical protein Ltb232_11370 [Lentilactobacillus buchneri subsp. silagei]GED91411.1 hypothetical protein LBSG162_05160 [Lentilactobacillus buchneri subsp. silagei]GED93784.1 hypothetical protein LBSP_03440 [Lentilactobacillus buchneri subsp. silagei]